MAAQHTTNRKSPDSSYGVPHSTGPDLQLEAELFWERYSTWILALVVALVMIGGGYGIYLYHGYQRNQKAFAQLEAAHTPAEYQAIIDQFGSTTTAASAYLLKAQAQREQNDFEGAAQTLQAFLTKYPQNEFAGAALLAQGNQAEDQNQWDQAAELYQRSVDQYPKDYSASFALLAKAQLQIRQNKSEDARHTLETLIVNYPQSVLIPAASALLQSVHPTKEAAEQKTP